MNANLYHESPFATTMTDDLYYKSLSVKGISPATTKERKSVIIQQVAIT